MTHDDKSRRDKRTGSMAPDFVCAEHLDNGAMIHRCMTTTASQQNAELEPFDAIRREVSSIGPVVATPG
ncbi:MULTISPECIES: hypothetical protein [unclassified Variovorax]|jgi:hypothetical protein|uniref:hypothetical protein n=1 Tax=unclassified Variovorax TaxID=663243 RepID=UPI0008AE2BDE|nr:MULTISPECIES: hypothetical protein [unclassified Variovorax]SEK13079.1 hypothetical protein SAMN05518853_11236 [Variovorax sp. OK202]SFD87760.1 hypothetical protein SAMN05444746_112146 [Variovorax sp. OK212]